jgi:hypothetical protein
MLNSQVGLAFEDGFHHRPVVGRKVLDDHETPASIDRGGVEESLQWFQAAGGSAKGNERNSIAFAGGFGIHEALPDVIDMRWMENC